MGSASCAHWPRHASFCMWHEACARGYCWFPARQLVHMVREHSAPTTVRGSVPGTVATQAYRSRHERGVYTSVQLVPCTCIKA